MKGQESSGRRVCGAVCKRLLALVKPGAGLWIFNEDSEERRELLLVDGKALLKRKAVIARR
jgi:hypothetical protein